jgi:hypothetical protein
MNKIVLPNLPNKYNVIRKAAQDPVRNGRSLDPGEGHNFATNDKLLLWHGAMLADFVCLPSPSSCVISMSRNAITNGSGTALLVLVLVQVFYHVERRERGGGGHKRGRWRGDIEGNREREGGEEKCVHMLVKMTWLALLTFRRCSNMWHCGLTIGRICTVSWTVYDGL